MFVTVSEAQQEHAFAAFLTEASRGREADQGEAEAVGGEQAAAAADKAEAEGEDRGASQPAGKANQCQPGAGEPKCKEAEASAGCSAAAEVSEFPAATNSEFPTA